MKYFESEHLIFRDWQDKDLEKFKIMNKDKEVMRFFQSTLTEAETVKFYEVIQQEFKEYGYGLFAVEEKEREEFIGFIGFHWARFDSEFTPCIEIGWRLDKSAWGKGFATEGAKACLNYGFRSLGFDRVYSFTSKTNIKSENVMKKIGLIKLDEFDHPKLEKESNLLRHVLYCMTYKDFLKVQGIMNIEVSKSSCKETSTNENFEDIYNLYFNKIYNLAYKMTGDQNAASDITQETFIKVLLNFDKYRGESHIYTRLYATAINYVL